MNWTGNDKHTRRDTGRSCFRTHSSILRKIMQTSTGKDGLPTVCKPGISQMWSISTDQFIFLSNFFRISQTHFILGWFLNMCFICKGANPLQYTINEQIKVKNRMTWSDKRSNKTLRLVRNRINNMCPLSLHWCTYVLSHVTNASSI
jgi:hypothetical protein